MSTVEIRPFFTKHLHHSAASATAYYETQPVNDEDLNSTKLSV